MIELSAHFGSDPLVCSIKSTQRLLPEDLETFSCNNLDQKSESLLIQKLQVIEGLSEVYLSPNELRLRKTQKALEWKILAPEVAKIIRNMLESDLDLSSYFTTSISLVNPVTKESNLAAAIQQKLNEHLNPQIEAHKGFIKVLSTSEDSKTVYVSMEGGCQGCGQASATLSQGVDKLIKEYFPEIENVIDQTEHEKGKSPFYAKSSMPTVIFYFDFFSPFSYLAFHYWNKEKSLWNQLAKWEFRPIPLVSLLSHYGQVGPGAISPKRKFLLKQILRKCHSEQIPFQGPSVWPFNSTLALRLISVIEDSNPEKLKLINNLWEKGWAKGYNLEDPEFLQSQVPENIWDLCHDAKGQRSRAQLKEHTKIAIDYGVFGVPSFYVKEKDELFWGADSLSSLANFLNNKDKYDQSLFKKSDF